MNEAKKLETIKYDDTNDETTRGNIGCVAGRIPRSGQYVFLFSTPAWDDRKSLASLQFWKKKGV